jgi:hypothetical protein
MHVHCNRNFKNLASNWSVRVTLFWSFVL